MQELWISKDGVRRKGTSLKEMMELFQSGITVSVIAEPLSSCVAEWDSRSAREVMDKEAFDTIGVLEHNNGPAIGYINKVDIQDGLCKDYTINFELKDLISNATPLIELLPKLKTAERYFVLTGNSVDRIITRADLQKPPVRIMIFGFISLLEMHMTRHIRKQYPNEEWQTMISEKRLEDAKDLQKDRSDRNEERDLIDCLQICDKRTIVVESDELRKIFGFASKKQGKKVLSGIEKLRDSLAHSQNIKSGVGWEAIIDRSLEAIKLIEYSECHLPPNEV